jgi:hypothetical protein
VRPSRNPAHDPGCCRYEHHRLGAFAAPRTSCPRASYFFLITRLFRSQLSKDNPMFFLFIESSYSSSEVANVRSTRVRSVSDTSGLLDGSKFALNNVAQRRQCELNGVPDQFRRDIFIIVTVDVPGSGYVFPRD